jgi:hypothetical protein
LCGHFSRLNVSTNEEFGDDRWNNIARLYGKRWGIRQSFKDIHNFDGAANFAAFIMADRIEVVREPTGLPSGQTAI